MSLISSSILDQTILSFEFKNLYFNELNKIEYKFSLKFVNNNSKYNKHSFSYHLQMGSILFILSKSSAENKNFALGFSHQLEQK